MLAGSVLVLACASILVKGAKTWATAIRPEKCKLQEQKQQNMPPTRIELVIFALYDFATEVKASASGTSATRYHCAKEANF